MCALSWGDTCVCFRGAWAGGSFASMLSHGVSTAHSSRPRIGRDFSLLGSTGLIHQMRITDTTQYYGRFRSISGSRRDGGRQRITAQHVHRVMSSLCRLSCLRVVTCQLSAERIEFKVGVYAPYSFSVDWIDASEWCCCWFCSGTRR